MSDGTAAGATLNVWLKETLSSLRLHDGFLNRILDSTQKTVARILQATVKVKLEHIHVRMFAPSNRMSQQQIWGFFTVEKLEHTEDGNNANDRTLEIYLYLEGEALPTRGDQ